MPTYNYKCSSCNSEAKQIRKVDDRENTGVCPMCGKNTLVDVPFTSGESNGIIFRGKWFKNTGGY